MLGLPLKMVYNVKQINSVFTCFYFLEQLVLSSYKDVKDTWEKDYDKLIKPLVEENQPSYILYR